MSQLQERYPEERDPLEGRDVLEGEVVGHQHERRHPPSTLLGRLAARTAFALTLGILGVVLTAAGILLTLTVVGALLGIPIALLGLGLAFSGLFVGFGAGQVRVTTFRPPRR